MLKKLSIKVIILLIIYSIVLICTNLVFTNKLNTQELQAVHSIYKEMRSVDDTIRSDFYINKTITLLDKQVVLENLRMDSVYYSVSVSEKAFNMLLNSMDNKAVEKYIQRCDLDFETFVGLDSATSLFDLYRAYFVDFSDSLDSLEALQRYMDEILEPENAFFEEIEANRNKERILIVSSFVGLLSIWMFAEGIIKKEDKKEKVDAE